MSVEDHIQKYIEDLSDYEHESWADWQSYLFSRCTENADGSMTIPKELVERWQRQIATPYNQLSETEKQSDRDQIEKAKPILVKMVEDWHHG